MANYTSYNPLGSDIQSNEIADGAVTYAKLGSDLQKAELIETLTYSADATQTSSSLSGYSHYILEFDISATNSVNINLRINGLSTNEYGGKYIGNTTISNITGRSSLELLNNSATYRVLGRVGVTATSTAGASGTVTINCELAGGGIAGTQNRFLNGYCILGDAVDVSTFQVYVTAGSMTGTVNIYGVA